MDAPGSSKLDTPEARQFYEDRFGVRLTHIPAQPFVVDDRGRATVKFNRKQRRQRRFRPDSVAYRI